MYRNVIRTESVNSIRTISNCDIFMEKNKQHIRTSTVVWNASWWVLAGGVRFRWGKARYKIVPEEFLLREWQNWCLQFKSPPMSILRPNRRSRLRSARTVCVFGCLYADTKTLDESYVSSFAAVTSSDWRVGGVIGCTGRWFLKMIAVPPLRPGRSVRRIW